MAPLDPHAAPDAAKEAADNRSEVQDIRHHYHKSQLQYAMLTNGDWQGYDRADVMDWLEDNAWIDLTFDLAWAVYNPHTSIQQLQSLSDQVKARINERLDQLADELVKHEGL